MDFSQFRTFKYKESESTLADTFPVAHSLVVNSIREGMIVSGLQEVNENPDLYVTYYGEENENIVIMTSGWEYNSPGNWPGTTSAARSVRGAGSLEDSPTRELVVREGTIMIDMWEAGEKELVWRAEISDTISSNPDRNRAKIKNGISKAFLLFPPGSGS